MRILLISDSHDTLLNEDFDKFDCIIHCGDYVRSGDILKNNEKIKWVRGNCDWEGRNELILDLFGRKVFVTHGHNYGVKEGYDRIKYRALEAGCSVCVFGHTHIPIWQPEDDLLTMNPGAYMDGFRIEIFDDHIEYWMDNRKYKNFEFKW